MSVKQAILDEFLKDHNSSCDSPKGMKSEVSNPSLQYHLKYYEEIEGEHSQARRVGCQTMAMKGALVFFLFEEEDNDGTSSIKLGTSN